MPQLVPYFFINQVTYTFVLLITMVYILSRYVLPIFMNLTKTRASITIL